MEANIDPRATIAGALNRKSDKGKLCLALDRFMSRLESCEIDELDDLGYQLESALFYMFNFPRISFCHSARSRNDSPFEVVNLSLCSSHSLGTGVFVLAMFVCIRGWMSCHIVSSYLYTDSSDPL